ncbi:MAG: 50S ribosomal protein L7/L12 [Candidatus Woesebacteria bacterium GW2011_GWB1_43_14]|uniref:Large ribosomal subunit protein bL12 n=1 Tax=Candidatus Woesebacteria bacterium GW2011_GWB1_43_14 TaxID=1618578 RepID=A0A0G1DH48_9BACT|nr:MAG: 50S ribosomal protein L7/L12 [Candidatus Woesebacteria bacterium GW2011_GWC1_42_9]KKS96912.1 MAG: 50S ribosomal protein L7/L12 [Candidatus Woesebacteria bacterium GW2011_GWB1_43_14]
MADKKESKAVSKLVDEISKLSVLELSELVTELQDKLGVSAVVPQMAAPAGAPAEGEAKKDEESATKTVVMTSAGTNKIAVIKALREINQNWGLKEAKDMTEQVPSEIVKDAKAEDAKKAEEALKTAGAAVELK